MVSLPRRLKAVSLCLVALGLAAPVVCFAGDAPVRLYTNEDLDRFPVLPNSSVAAARPPTDEWDRVVEYLNREHSRIDAERAYELQRNQSEAEVELIRHEANRRAYSLPFGAWGNRGWYDRVSRGNAVGRSLREHGGTIASGGAIRPLHAGPTRAQIDRYKATRRSGADAVPNRSRGGGGSNHRPSPHRPRPH